MEKIIEKSKKIIEIIVIILLCFVGIRRGGYYKVDSLFVMYIIDLLILLYLILSRKIKISPKVIFFFLLLIAAYFSSIVIGNSATVSGAINIATRIYSIYLLYILITNSENKEKYIKSMLVFIAIVGLLVLDETSFRIFEKPLNFLGGAYVSEVGEAPETIFQYTNFLGILCLVSIIYLYRCLSEREEIKNKVFLYTVINYFTIIMFYSHSKMIFILYIVTAIALPIILKKPKEILYLIINFVFSLIVYSFAKIYLIIVALVLVAVISFGYLYYLKNEKIKRILSICSIVILCLCIVIFLNKILNSSVILNFKDYFSNFRSTSLRFTYYLDGLRIATSSPLNFIFGAGGNAFRTLYETVQTTFYVSLEVHSLFIQVFIESGVIGLISLILIIIFSFKHSKNNVYRYMLGVYLIFATFDISLTYLFILYFFTILLALNSNDEKMIYANKRLVIYNGIMYVCIMCVLTLQVLAMVIEPTRVDNLNVTLDEQQKIIDECKLSCILDPSDIEYIRMYSRSCINYLDIMDIKKDLYGQDNLEKRYELVNIIYSNLKSELRYEKSNKYAIDDNVFYTCKYVDELVAANYLGNEVEGYEYYLEEMLDEIEEFKTHSLNDYAQIQYVLGLKNIYYKYIDINTMLHSDKITLMLDNIKEIAQ